MNVAKQVPPCVGVHIEQGGQYAWKLTGVRVVWLHIGVDVCAVVPVGGNPMHYRGLDALMFALEAGVQLAALKG